MSIWDIDIGWFFLGAALVVGVVIISIERICYNDKRAMYVTSELDKEATK